VPFKDHLSIADWKSSNYLSISYLFQTAAYEAFYEEEMEVDVEDRWVLRLGKSEEEAGKFEPWHLTAEDFAEDFAGYLACLSLSNLVDSVEERMKKAKGTIRAIKKVQKETAKALAKEQAKLQKAMDKAAAKIAKEAEKVRVKAEAKAAREVLKKEKLCTSISSLKKDSTPLDTTVPPPVCETLSSSPSLTTEEWKKPHTESTSSTVETKYEEAPPVKFNIPMEG
jgi:hypothetical protein